MKWLNKLLGKAGAGWVRRDPDAGNALALGPGKGYGGVLASLTGARCPVAIREITKRGVVVFSLPTVQLGLSREQLDDFNASHCNFLIDILGEALIRRNLDLFLALIETRRDYDRLCKEYAHRRFAFQSTDSEATFYFHISLLHRILNDELEHEFLPDGTEGLKVDGLNVEGVVCQRVSDPGRLFFKRPVHAPQGGLQGMSPMFEMVIQFFRDDEWKFEQVEGRTTLRMGVRGRNGEYHCLAIVNEQTNIFLFRTKSAISAPEDKRLAVAEFITRANYGLAIGNFEFDFVDGEIAYKTSIDVEGDRLSPMLIRHLVHSNLSTFDRYYPGVMKVIYSDVSPEEAVKAIEK